MRYDIETELEEDGRWIAEISSLPGAMAYGKTRSDAIANVTAIALRIIADRVEHAEMLGSPLSVSFDAAA